MLLLNTIIWGSTFFIIKGNVNNISPALLVAGRTLIAALVMLTIAAITEKRKILAWASIKNGTILGFLLMLTYLSQTIGLQYTSSGHSAFITGAAVIIVPILSKLYFRNPLSLSTIVAVVLVTIGLFALSFDIETKINIGDAITLITALSYAHHLILSGRFVKNTPLFSLVGYQFLSAGIFSLIYHVVTGASWTIPDSGTLVAVAYLGFFGTLFCYFISIWAQKKVSATKVAVIFSLESLFAAIFGYFMLGEILTRVELLGASAILTGVITYQICQFQSKKNNH